MNENYNSSKYKPFLIVAVILIIGLVIAGYFIYQDQQNTIRTEQTARVEAEVNISTALEELDATKAKALELQAEAQARLEELDATKAKALELQAKALELQAEAQARAEAEAAALAAIEAAKLKPQIKIIAPTGGEVLCLGESYEIVWESKEVSAVGLVLTTGSGGNSFPSDSTTIMNGSKEVETGSYVWDVGQVAGGYILGKGAYQISLNGIPLEGDSVHDQSDKFVIDDCMSDEELEDIN